MSRKTKKNLWRGSVRDVISCLFEQPYLLGRQREEAEGQRGKKSLTPLIYKQMNWLHPPSAPLPLCPSAPFILVNQPDMI